MNDYSELEHGIDLVSKAFQSDSAGQRFRQALDLVAPGCGMQTAERFDTWLPQFRSETFITCVSEHDDDEDDLGRLSMWRAYGASAGVAFVLNQGPFTSESDALNAYTYPVRYYDQGLMDSEFDEVATAIEQNADFIRAQGAEQISAVVFEFFRSLVVATKHKGFAEEREWRVIHTPGYQPSERLIPSIETARGIPQTVFKIPLKDVPEEGLAGMQPKDLINRIIIGPSEDAYVVAEAFARQLKILGVEDAWSRIKISNIPLRNLA